MCWRLIVVLIPARKVKCPTNQASQVKSLSYLLSRRGLEPAQLPLIVFYYNKYLN